ncbi:MAG TPA: hypothetical protein VFR24_13440 [Candidatus Angelobacter sp.]|nr:hypothetical protein [Candidatus Angelobacter sp.]
MSHDLLWNILRNPLTKVLLAVAIILVLLWRLERRNKRAIREFAASKGYSFDPRLEGDDLHLEETSFFQKGDVIKNVVRGVLPNTTVAMGIVLRGGPFVLFEHETTRREDGDSTQTIVAFEVNPESSVRQKIVEANGVQMEWARNHVFFWKKQGRVPARQLEQFLISARQSYVFGSLFNAAKQG